MENNLTTHTLRAYSEDTYFSTQIDRNIDILTETTYSHEQNSRVLTLSTNDSRRTLLHRVIHCECGLGEGVVLTCMATGCMLAGFVVSLILWNKGDL